MKAEATWSKGWALQECTQLGRDKVRAVIADHVKGVISFRASPDERPVRLTKLGADDKLERTTEGAVNGTTFDLAGAVQRANALE